VEARSAEEAALRAEREGVSAERAEAAERIRREEIDLRRRYEDAVNEALGKIGEAAAAVANEIRDRAAALQAKSEMRRSVRKAAETIRPEIAPPEAVHLRPGDLAGEGRASSWGEIQPGAMVRVGGLGATGKVESVDTRRGRADVLIRNKKMTVTLGDLDLIQAAPRAAERVPPTIPKGVTLSTSGKESLSPEINLIGRTVEEALGLLDKFLDDAVLAGHREVRVVHGHGTGRLRIAVQEFLSTHPLVSSHRPADSKAGGSGATVALLQE